MTSHEWTAHERVLTAERILFYLKLSARCHGLDSLSVVVTVGVGKSVTVVMRLGVGMGLGVGMSVVVSVVVGMSEDVAMSEGVGEVVNMGVEYQRGCGRLYHRLLADFPAMPTYS